LRASRLDDQVTQTGCLDEFPPESFPLQWITLSLMRSISRSNQGQGLIVSHLASDQLDKSCLTRPIRVVPKLDLAHQNLFSLIQQSDPCDG
jgi:hypothetical protein